VNTFYLANGEEKQEPVFLGVDAEYTLMKIWTMRFPTMEMATDFWVGYKASMETRDSPMPI